MYKLFIRPILFRFSPETIHHIIFKSLKLFCKIPGMSSLFRSMYKMNDDRLEREVFGIRFKNPVGLAAGLDKDAELIDELSAMGFGFIEIGTLTPVGQPGNDKPRLFRLTDDQAIINRMGFNNLGVESAIQKLKKRKSDVIVGGNIGKNKLTPNENALEDYKICFEALFPYVDYFVINVSSPNTPNLRALQEKEPLTKLLSEIKKLSLEKPTPKPVLLKIAPDLTDSQLDDIIEIVQQVGVDGVIATNTTISRASLKTNQSRIETIGAGGLSGKPLAQRSTEVIKYLHKNSKGSFPIIGVGGIHSEEDALEKIKAGAALVQLYTGFIYEGPALIKKINQRILKEKK